MSARQPRFEICRGDDGGPQPWWARFRSANGRIVWVTENYTRRRGAEKAILAIAGWQRGNQKQVRNVLLGDKVIEVREVDER